MCTNLIRGWRSQDRNPETGKRATVYRLKQGYYDLKSTVPCGQCMECRLKNSREVAIRCTHEAEQHTRNTVVTLTYATENLPANGSIEPKHAEKFIADLREWAAYHENHRGIKTWGCAEYGCNNPNCQDPKCTHGMRPHYHIILFNYDFKDKKQADGKPPGYYTSDILTQIWDRGGTQLMDLTFESAAYVARYITKKLTGPRANEYLAPHIEKLRQQGCTMLPGDKLPEQTVCLTQKGLGKNWYKEWKEETYNNDKVYRSTKDGRRIPMRPPKYYDRQYEIDNNADYERIKKERKMKNKKRLKKIEKEIMNGNITNAFDQGIGSRDIAKRMYMDATHALLKRGYENET